MMRAMIIGAAIIDPLLATQALVQDRMVWFWAWWICALSMGVWAWCGGWNKKPGHARATDPAPTRVG